MAKYTLNPTCSKPTISIPVTKSQKWYVYFVYRDANNKRQQYKIYGDLNDSNDTKSTRILIAKNIIENLNKKLTERVFDVISKKFLGDVIEGNQVGKYIEEYLNLRKKELEPNSFRLYNYSLSAFKDYIGSKLVTNISSDDIEDYFKFKGFKSHTKKYTKTNINAFYKWLIKKYKLSISNPASGVSVGKTETTDIHSVMSETEFTKLMNLAEAECDTPFVLALKLIFNTLVRPVEITRIQIEDVNLDRNTIFLSKGKGKNKSLSRYLIIDSWFRPYLENLGIDFKNPEIAKKYLIAGGTGYSIVLAGDKQLNPDRLTNRFTALRYKLGINKDCSMYGLKHLGNMHLLIKHKIDKNELSLRNGHRSTSVTDIYLTDLKRKAPELLAK